MEEESGDSCLEEELQEAEEVESSPERVSNDMCFEDSVLSVLCGPKPQSRNSLCVCASSTDPQKDKDAAEPPKIQEGVGQQR